MFVLEGTLFKSKVIRFANWCENPLSNPVSEYNMHALISVSVFLGREKKGFKTIVYMQRVLGSKVEVQKY